MSTATVLALLRSCQRPWTWASRRAFCQAVVVATGHGQPELAQSADISVLVEREDLDEIETPRLNLKPAFNLAAYVHRSDTLQQLLKLGVDLHRVEKKPELAQLVLALDFQRDIQPHLLFLRDQGVAETDLGRYLTRNPAILKESLDDLQVRIDFLRLAKRFKKSQVERIIAKNPFWLMFPTPKIDDRLGFFQRQFHLTGAETRQLAVSQPRVITYSIEHIRKASFTVLEEVGMTKQETKDLILKLPKVLMMDPKNTVEKFDFLHNQMSISHQQIIDEPLVFLSRQHRIEQRHKFLVYLNKAQYDRKLPMYVSLTSLVSGNDEEFVMNVARSDLRTFTTFLKSL